MAYVGEYSVFGNSCGGYIVFHKCGGLYAYVYFLGRITIAIFGISFAQYLASLLPALGDPLSQKIVAAAVLTFFFVVNLFGMKAAAKLQDIMFFVLISGLLIFIGCGIPKVSSGFFEESPLFLNGFGGFYQAVSLLYFAVGGSYIMTDFAPSVKDSGRTVIKVIYIVTAGVCVIYMLLGIVASGVVPVSEAANKPLTVAARVVFGDNQVLFSLFIIGACIGALLTTLNSSFVWYSNSLIKTCEEGWLPKKWAKKNKHGAPYILMSIFYIYGLVPTLLGIDLSILSKAAIGLTILATCIPMLGVVNLPEKFPEEWKMSKFSKKYPKWRLYTMCVITYVIMLTQVVALFVGNPPLANIIICVCLAIISLYLLMNKSCKKSKED